MPFFDSARGAVFGLTFWTDVGLISLVGLLVSRVIVPLGGEFRKYFGFAVALFCVTGLDLIPYVFIVALNNVGGLLRLPIDFEWWNDQVVSWFGNFLWVPHHIA